MSKFIFIFGVWLLVTVITQKAKDGFYLEEMLAHLQDHLERSLRPIQATQMTLGPIWTRQKRL